MPASQLHVGPNTPLGANLVGTGATFRAWAPRAQAVFACGTFAGANCWPPIEAQRLTKDAQGYWSGFIDGVQDGDEYKFYVIGNAPHKNYKRDPYARELTTEPKYPFCNCVVRDPASFPWHDAGYSPPRFNDLVIYQLHLGTFYGPNRAQRTAKFLDVLDRIDYLVALGVNAIQPLPISEVASPRSMGYEGSDLFSPEMDFWVPPGTPELAAYLQRVNALLTRSQKQPLTAQQLSSQVNQLKALIDVCHLNGIAVIFDVVYNHAGGQITGQDESLWFFDRMTNGNKNNSLYFTDRDHTGPVFAIWLQEVRQFLIDNAGFFISEYHADGFRYDQVSVIVAENTNDGWRFCQDLTRTVRLLKPAAIQIAEYWDVNPAVVRSVDEGGAGFDATWHDGQRESIRGAIAAAAQGADSFVDLDRVAANLHPPGFPLSWKAVQYIESHDEVYRQREPRIPALADGDNHRTWYARSRARVGTGLLLTAPGIPMLFMGQEFLEDKRWSDDPPNWPGSLIWWEGLEWGEKPMVDHLRFTSELIALRRHQPALRGESINVFHRHNGNRVIAFHRWLEGYGRDVVVVASLNESTYAGYGLGFPGGGTWKEVFNSDVYDNWVNPLTSGNGGAVWAGGPPLHGLPASANIVIPANGLLVFARDDGD